MTARRPRSTTAREPRWRSALLAVLSTTLLLGTLELLAALVSGSEAAILVENAAMGHMTGPLQPWMRVDEELLWTFRTGPVEQWSPGKERSWRYVVNAEGFRGPLSGTTTSRRVVVCAGDSVTAGYGVDDGKTYPDVLQGMLAAEPGWQSALVLNRGVNGYSSEQGLALLGETFEERPPEALVVSYGIDDDWLSIYPDALVMGRDSRLARLRPLLRRSHVYRVLRGAIVGARSRRAAAAGQRRARVPLDRYVRNLASMAAMAKARGTHVVFVAPTSRYEQGARRFDPGNPENLIERPLSEYRAAMAEVAAREGLSFVDDPLLSGRSPDSPRRFVDWCHPDANGLALLARRAAAAIVAGGPRR